MDNKEKYGIIKAFVAGIFSTLLVIGCIFVVKNWDSIVKGQTVPTEYKAQKKVADIYGKIEDTFLGDVDVDQLSEFMCAGLVAGLQDKYSTYYTQEQYEKIMQSANGHYTGIGVAISNDDDGNIVIESCYEGTPASKAGIEPGDILQKIGDTSMAGMKTSEVVKLIQAAKIGSTLSFTLQRGGDVYTADIAIEEVESVSVSGEMLEDGIGYIRISEFTGVTSQQFEEAYGKLQGEGMTRLIIDLRSNPGGLVNGVCDTLRQILPKGLIVYTEDKYGNRIEQNCEGETPISMPLAVLVNSSSASAAEIFAGAVKDYGIGTIVGTVTYGKGVVQDTYQLSSGGAVKLTVSHYFTPNGNNINGKGITPDVAVEQPDQAEEDYQLNRAKELLLKQ